MITVVTIAESRKDDTRISNFVFAADRSYGEVLAYFADHLADRHYSEHTGGQDKASLLWRETVKDVLDDLRGRPAQGLNNALLSLSVAYEAFARGMGNDVTITIDLSGFDPERVQGAIRWINP